MVFRYSTVDGFADRPLNNFKNDGSFLETFKKLQSAAASGSANSGGSQQQQQQQPSSSSSKSSSGSSNKPSSSSSSSSLPPSDRPAAAPAPSSSTSVSSSSSSSAKPAPPLIGKRRGGRILPTGKVKKVKTEEEVEETPKDAWSLYLREVKRYRETTCQEEDGKTRPLVK